MLDAMDVRSQNGIKLSLGDFVKYFKLPKSERKSQLFNVLSLEFSKTKMDDEILAPEVVKTMKKRLNYIENLCFISGSPN